MMEEQDLCAVIQLSGPGRAEWLWGGQEEQLDGGEGGQELLAELGCKELVEGSGGQESLLWRDREGDIKARSRELRKKAELASPTLCLRLRVRKWTESELSFI